MEAGSLTTRAVKAIEQARRAMPELRYSPEAKKLVTDSVTGLDGLCEAMGVSSEEAAALLATLAVKSSVVIGPGCENGANSVLALLAECQPQDGVETMLVSMMITTQVYFSKVMAKVNSAGAIDTSEKAIAGPTRLIVAQAKLAEALSKYRRGGEQRVVVEHLTVEGGGQALIGNVTK